MSRNKDSNLDGVSALRVKFNGKSKSKETLVEVEQPTQNRKRALRKRTKLQGSKSRGIRTGMRSGNRSHNDYSNNTGGKSEIPGGKNSEKNGNKNKGKNDSGNKISSKIDRHGGKSDSDKNHSKFDSEVESGNENCDKTENKKFNKKPFNNKNSKSSSKNSVIRSKNFRRKSNDNSEESNRKVKRFKKRNKENAEKEDNLNSENVIDGNDNEEENYENGYDESGYDENDEINDENESEEENDDEQNEANNSEENGNENSEENEAENGDENYENYDDENAEENSNKMGEENLNNNSNENSNENGDENGEENLNENSDENLNENGDENSNKKADEISNENGVENEMKDTMTIVNEPKTRIQRHNEAQGLLSSADFIKKESPTKKEDNGGGPKFTKCGRQILNTPWWVIMDPNAEKYYYYNAENKATSWKLPDDIFNQYSSEILAIKNELNPIKMPELSTSPEMMQKLPEMLLEKPKIENKNSQFADKKSRQIGVLDWWEINDSKSQYIYFYNTVLGKTFWDIPADVYRVYQTLDASNKPTLTNPPIQPDMNSSTENAFSVGKANLADAEEPSHVRSGQITSRQFSGGQPNGIVQDNKNDEKGEKNVMEYILKNRSDAPNSNMKITKQLSNSEWYQIYDTSCDTLYYLNSNTKTTSWNCPKELESFKTEDTLNSLESKGTPQTGQQRTLRGNGVPNLLSQPHLNLSRLNLNEAKEVESPKETISSATQIEERLRQQSALRRQYEQQTKSAGLMMHKERIPNNVASLIELGTPPVNFSQAVSSSMVSNLGATSPSANSLKNWNSTRSNFMGRHSPIPKNFFPPGVPKEGLNKASLKYLEKMGSISPQTLQNLTNSQNPNLAMGNTANMSFFSKSNAQLNEAAENARKSHSFAGGNSAFSNIQQIQQLKKLQQFQNLQKQGKLPLNQRNLMSQALQQNIYNFQSSEMNNKMAYNKLLAQKAPNKFFNRDRGQKRDGTMPETSQKKLKGAWPPETPPSEAEIKLIRKCTFPSDQNDGKTERNCTANCPNASKLKTLHELYSLKEKEKLLCEQKSQKIFRELYFAQKMSKNYAGIFESDLPPDEEFLTRPIPKNDYQMTREALDAVECAERGRLLVALSTSDLRQALRLKILHANSSCLRKTFGYLYEKNLMEFAENKILHPSHKIDEKNAIIASKADSKRQREMFYSCFTCSRRFKTERELDTHYAADHLRQLCAPISCSSCNAIFNCSDLHRGHLPFCPGAKRQPNFSPAPEVENTAAVSLTENEIDSLIKTEKKDDSKSINESKKNSDKECAEIIANAERKKQR